MSKSSSIPWPVETIGNIAEINPRQGKSARPEPEMPVSFVPMAAVSEISARITDPTERPYSEVARGFTTFRNKDVLFAKITPCMENGKVAIACNLRNGIGFGSTEFHVIRAADKVIPEYLWYFMRTQKFRDEAKARMVGAGGQQRVPTEFIRDASIPLPPLPEQHRIVEILDQADTLRRQRREADELSKRILPALFQEMFGDPNRNERNWPIDEFDAAFEDISRLGNKIPRSEYLPEGDIPVIDQGQDDVAGFWNNREDVFRGSIPVILFGDHTRIFKLIESPFCIGADGVRLLKPRKMNFYFAFGMLSMLDVPSRGYSRHFKELKGLSYINPPIDLQERFGKALVQVRKTIQTATTSSTTLETLFQTLLHRAFDGRLTAQWREAHARELLQEMGRMSRV